MRLPANPYARAVDRARSAPVVPLLLSRDRLGVLGGLFDRLVDVLERFVRGFKHLTEGPHIARQSGGARGGGPLGKVAQGSVHLLELILEYPGQFLGGIRRDFVSLLGILHGAV